MDDTSVEHALLVLAFGAEPAARRAWTSLEGRLDIAQLPFELHSTFPSVAAALRRLHIEALELPRFDGVRKRLWALNVVKARALAEVTDALASAGVQHRVTGGMAVLLLRDDFGTRPLTEIDVILDASESNRALELVEQAGWHVVETRRDGFLMDYVAIIIAKAGQSLTLRWRDMAVGVVGTLGHTHPPIVVRASAIAPSAVAVAVPAEVLAFTLIDGLGLPGYSRVRRRLDALLLAESTHEEIAWPAFIDAIRGRHAEPEVLPELRELNDFSSAVPRDVVRALVGARPPRYERLGGPIIRLSPVLAGCLRRHRGASLTRLLRTLPRELSAAWGLPGIRSLPIALTSRLARRIVERVRPDVGG